VAKEGIHGKDNQEDGCQRTPSKSKINGLAAIVVEGCSEGRNKYAHAVLVRFCAAMIKYLSNMT
jgi:hypothetical protein